MSNAAHETREEEGKWLVRPVYLAENVVFFSFVYGAVYYWFGLTDERTLIIGLVAAMGIASVLLFWAHARIMNAARGRG
jgi:uncharacterized membrane protein